MTNPTARPESSSRRLPGAAGPSGAMHLLSARRARQVGASHPPGRRDGVSLIELMVVLTILGVLIAMAVPSFRRSLEQSRADIAVANLYTIWSAQRLYWLKNRTFTDDLSNLQASDLIDPALSTTTNPYQFAIEAADTTTFSATAIRNGSAAWSGTFTIDQTGAVSGTIANSLGESGITPGFQY